METIRKIQITSIYTSPLRDSQRSIRTTRKRSYPPPGTRISLRNHDRTLFCLTSLKGQAISRLILAGTLDKFPELRILLAHSGGTIPFLAGRLDSCVAHDPTVRDRLNHEPSWYLKKLYYDGVGYHSPALKLAKELVGADRIMFG
jgi:predicted TIM-barrel fold metal-dependent hydrolase